MEEERTEKALAGLSPGEMPSMRPKTRPRKRRYILAQDLDGKYIATTSTDPASNSRLVLLIPTAGGEARELTRVLSEVEPERLNFPALEQIVQPILWTPDSQSLLLHKVPTHRTKDGELWLVPVNGGEPKRIIGDGKLLFGSISKSPDGHRFVYAVTEPAPPLTLELAVLENFLPKFAK